MKQNFLAGIARVVALKNDQVSILSLFGITIAAGSSITTLMVRLDQPNKQALRTRFSAYE
jgi:hypothetical protein